MIDYPEYNPEKSYRGSGYVDFDYHLFRTDLESDWIYVFNSFLIKENEGNNKYSFIYLQ